MHHLKLKREDYQEIIRLKFKYILQIKQNFQQYIHLSKGTKLIHSYLKLKVHLIMTHLRKSKKITT